MQKKEAGEEEGCSSSKEEEVSRRRRTRRRRRRKRMKDCLQSWRVATPSSVERGHHQKNTFSITNRAPPTSDLQPGSAASHLRATKKLLTGLNPVRIQPHKPFTAHHTSHAPTAPPAGETPLPTVAGPGIRRRRPTGGFVPGSVEAVVGSHRVVTEETFGPFSTALWNSRNRNTSA